MKTAFIKPAKGLLVPDPDTGKNLPEGGAIVTINRFWKRRIKDGDVTIVKSKSK